MLVAEDAYCVNNVQHPNTCFSSFH